MKKILVIGSPGQIGSELTPVLRKIYGENNVIAGYYDFPLEGSNGPAEKFDAMDAKAIAEIVKKYDVDTIYNLAAILSAKAEANPIWGWNVGMQCLLNCLEVAREYNCALFTPSSIGAFGPNTPQENTPQDTIQRPETIYGITKVAGELLSDYYYKKYGVDTRSVRYPGIISNVTLPGGGTTDYAVEIYYAAVKGEAFSCPLPAGTFLDMMYMPDAIHAAISLMEADPQKLVHRNSFNVTAMSFEPDMIYNEIKKHIPTFKMEYHVDPLKKSIAESWPNSMDDACAREEWGWSHQYNLASMTTDMLAVLAEKHKKGLI